MAKKTFKDCPKCGGTGVIGHIFGIRCNGPCKGTGKVEAVGLSEGSVNVMVTVITLKTRKAANGLPLRVSLPTMVYDIIHRTNPVILHKFHHVEAGMVAPSTHKKPGKKCSSITHFTNRDLLKKIPIQKGFDNFIDIFV